MLSDEELLKKYGSLVLCSIEERYWAVNGKYINELKNDKINQLKQEIEKLKNNK